MTKNLQTIALMGEYDKVTEKRAAAYTQMVKYAAEKEKLGAELLEAFINDECNELGVSREQLCDSYRNAINIVINSEVYEGMATRDVYSYTRRMNRNLAKAWRNMHMGLVDDDDVSPALAVALIDDAINKVGKVTKTEINMYNRVKPVFLEILDNVK